MKPTGAAAQFGTAKPTPRMPGAIRLMLPVDVLTQPGTPEPFGTETVRGLVPGVETPASMALFALVTSRAGFVTLMLMARSRCVPCVKLYPKLTFQFLASSRSMVKIG